VGSNICTPLDRINDISNAKFYLTRMIKRYIEVLLQLSEKGQVSRIL